MFVANGDSNPMILPRYSYLLAGLLPVLTPAGILDRDKQLGVVEELTEIVAAAAGDPSLRERTWVLLTESPEGAGESPVMPTPTPTSQRSHELRSKGVDANERDQSHSVRNNHRRSQQTAWPSGRLPAIATCPILRSIPSKIRR